MYEYVKSLCSIPDIHTEQYVNYISMKLGKKRKKMISLFLKAAYSSKTVILKMMAVIVWPNHDPCNQEVMRKWRWWREIATLRILTFQCPLLFFIGDNISMFYRKAYVRKWVLDLSLHWQVSSLNSNVIFL